MKTLRIFGAGLYLEAPPMPDLAAAAVVDAVAHRWKAASAERVTVGLDSGEQIHLHPVLVSALVVADPEDPA